MDKKIPFPTAEECGVQSDSPLMDKLWPKTITVSHSPSKKKSRTAIDAISQQFSELKQAAAVLLNGIDEGTAEPDKPLPDDVSDAIKDINQTLAHKFSK